MAFSLFGWKKKEGSEEKAEMSFIDHLEVLRKHLFRSVLFIVLGMIVAGIYNDFIVDKIVLGPIHEDFVTFKKICEWGRQIGLGDKMCIGKIGVTMQNVDTTGQVSLFFTSMFVTGFILAFPFVFREFWKFVKPALTKKRIKENPWSDLLGLFLIFYWCFVWLFYSHAF